MALPLQRRLGVIVRRLRVDRGYSQEDFADAIGVHRTTMGRIERGDFNVTLETLQRLARGLNVLASELLAQSEQEGRRRASRGSRPATLPSPTTLTADAPDAPPVNGG
jgi:transcriptional regulator with XRE-family HTH domain